MRNVTPTNLKVMPKDENLAPDQIRFLALRLDPQGNDIGFEFRDGGIVQVGGWSDADRFIKEAMQDRWKHHGKPGFDPIHSTPSRPRFGISIATPSKHSYKTKSGHVVDFPEPAKCLFVLRLDEWKGSRGPNWHFNTGFGPFSCDSTSTGIYSNACYLDGNLPSVRIYPDGKSNPQDTWPRSRWAAFLLDVAKLKEAARDEGVADNYALPFNIHVDIEDKKTRHFLPIIIDPDVGHPGGTLPPPDEP